MKIETTKIASMTDAAISRTESIDKAKLDEYVKSGKAQGPFNVTVQRNEENNGYELWGDYPEFVPTDDATAQYQHDLGLTPFEVMTGDGQPLAYNKAARELFAVRKGRASSEDGAKAVMWCAVNEPGLFNAKDIAGMRAAWTKAGKP